jgi:uncharacterized membrane protein
MPDELIVFFTSMTPIGELRASVPLGLLTYDLSWQVVFVLAVIGNFLPVPVVLFLLRLTGDRLQGLQNPIGALLRWRAGQVKRVWEPRVQRYGFWAIVLIVAIPLPFTGAWTGTLVVWALNVRTHTGLAAIALGVVIAGGTVTGVTQAGSKLFGSA